MVPQSERRFLLALGERIRTLRRARGLSQEQVGMRSGIHRTYISSLECGQRNVAIINLRRIAASLDVPVSALLDFARDP